MRNVPSSSLLPFGAIAMMRPVLLVLAIALSACTFAEDAPIQTPAPAAATHYPVDMVSCRDGTMAQLPVKQGTCSLHGGVGPAAPAGSTALCKDGTYSLSKVRRNTCIGHKGVARWLDQ